MGYECREMITQTSHCSCVNSSEQFFITSSAPSSSTGKYWRWSMYFWLIFKFGLSPAQENTEQSHFRNIFLSYLYGFV